MIIKIFPNKRNNYSRDNRVIQE